MELIELIFALKLSHQFKMPKEMQSYNFNILNYLKRDLLWKENIKSLFLQHIRI